jgi:dGTPase
MVWTIRLSGLQRQRGPFDFRSPYERDKTRVIHSAAFRRLQHKTQIYGGHGGNFHRTRLTHSLEVASIATSIVHYLHEINQKSSMVEHLPSDDLIEVISLLHDIGHPPFGHGGEAALNALMAAYGGFESNAQTLHLVSSLETAYEPFGLDLSRRSLLGILKYPIAYAQAKKAKSTGSSHLLQNQDRSTWTSIKAYYDFNQELVTWILEPFSREDRQRFQSFTADNRLHHSFDCSIMDIADDIAYGVHDLEDAIHLGLMTRHHLDMMEVESIFAEIKALDYCKVMDGLFDYHPAIRKQTIGGLVNFFVSSIVVHHHPEFEHPLLAYQAELRDEARRLLDVLIACVFQQVIDSPPARAQEYGSQNVLIDLFQVIKANPHRLLDAESRGRLLSIKQEGELDRIVCDCLANLTDDAAIKLHAKLFAEKFSAEWMSHLFS